MDWREMAAAALRSAGRSKSEKAAALKRAGEEYRAMKGRRRNPGFDLKKAVLIGGAAFVAVKVLPGLIAPQAPPPAPAPQVRQ